MGTPAFSVPILEGLIKADYEILYVVTQPDRLVGRKKIVTPPPVKSCALEYQLPVLQPEKISGSSEMETIMAAEPDLIITAAFGQFLPEKLLKAPKFGAINVHASLLPKYRGGAPIHYALINGEKETGITIMEMVKKMDAGAILAQQSLSITEQDDVGTLFDKLSIIGRDLLLATLPDLFAGKITPKPQNEAEATFSPNIQREEEKLSWEKTAQEIDWQVRGMRPFPVAFTTYQSNRLKIWDVSLVSETTDQKPGTIVAINKKNFWIAAGNGTIVQINELQPAGKGRLKAVDYLNGIGKQLEVGDHVGDE